MGIRIENNSKRRNNNEKSISSRFNLKTTNNNYNDKERLNGHGSTNQ
jgi:hypothetical protein